MALDHLIAKARDYFGIQKPEDWCAIRPEFVRQVPGCGPATLNHVRLYLAARGLTLKDDATPAFWQKNLAAVKIGGQVSAVDTAETEDFTVLIDTQEKHPFTFQGHMRGDKPLIVPYQFKHLGPTHGDYSIVGHEMAIHVERKSMEDAHGTFMSYGERGERWERTLGFLSEIAHSMVVIECSFGTLIDNIQPRGTKPLSVLRRQLHRQVLAWQDDYRVPFVFCDTRRFAEVTTLSFLRRAWKREAGLHRSRSRAEIEAAIDAL